MERGVFDLSGGCLVLIERNAAGFVLGVLRVERGNQLGTVRLRRVGNIREVGYVICGRLDMSCTVVDRRDHLSITSERGINQAGAKSMNEWYLENGTRKLLHTGSKRINQTSPF